MATLSARRLARRKDRNRESNAKQSSGFNFCPSVSSSPSKDYFQLKLEKESKSEVQKMETDDASQTTSFSTVTRTLPSAISSHNLALVEELLTAGQNPSSRPADWNAQLSYSLLLAVTTRKPNILKLLLDNGADAHMYDRWYPIIFTALDIKQPEIFDILLGYCSKEDFTAKLNSHNGNLLHAAVRAGNLDAVKKVCELFQQFGVDLDAKNESDGNTPLHLAVTCVPLQPSYTSLFAGVHFKGKKKNKEDNNKKKRDEQMSEEEMEKNLETRNDNIRKKKGTFGSNKMVMEHSLEILRYLLSLGLNVNATNKSRSTPLHDAAKMGYDQECSLLLEHGANTHLEDDMGRVPWFYALQNNHQQVMEVIAKDRNIKDISINGQSLLHLACASGSLVCVKSLVQGGCDPKAEDRDGRTPLMLAAKNGRVQCVQYLLENCDCDINKVSEMWGSAIQVALDSQNSTELFNRHKESILEALVKHGANVDVKDKEGFTPILRLYENNDAWKYLLKHSAYLNIIANNGQNILHMEVIKGGANFEDRILKNNIDVTKLVNTILMPHGLTPLMTALQAGNKQLCENLLNVGASCQPLRKWQQDGYLRQMHGENEHLQEVIERIEREIGSMPTLQDLSRQAVLNGLGFGEIEEKTESLCMPVLLRKYLKWPAFMRWKSFCSRQSME